MPRFLMLPAAGLSAATLYNIIRSVLEGTLDAAIVPLAAGLVAWSSIVLAVTLPPVERNFSAGTRLDWLVSAQVSFALALLDGAPLWRLAGGYHPLILAGLLAIPMMALTHVTASALFTRAEREAWTKRARRTIAPAPSPPSA